MVISATLLLAPVLSSCLNEATDREYTPAAGTNNRDGEVDVLGVTVVSTEAGRGSLIATFVNNSQDEPASISSIGGDISVENKPTIEIPARGFLNLADEDAPEVAATGDFEAGDFVNVTFELGDGTMVDLDVPVVANSGIYADLDGPATDEEGLQGPAGDHGDESEGDEGTDSGTVTE